MTLLIESNLCNQLLKEMEKEELFLASCKQGDFAEFYKLLSSGVDVNYKNGEPLREAITNNHVMIWTTLLDKPGIDPNLRDENGRSALHVACWFNKESATAKLLSLPHVRPNDKDVHGNTPIMMAAKYGTKGGIIVLLNNKEIDLEAVDNMGRGLDHMIRESWRMTAEEKTEMEEIIQSEKRRRLRELGLHNTTVPSLDDEVIAISNMKQEVLSKVEELNVSLDKEEMAFSALLEDQMKIFKEKQESEKKRICARQEKDLCELRAKQKQEENELLTKQVKDNYKMKVRQGREWEEMVEKQKQQKEMKIAERKSKLKSMIQHLDGTEDRNVATPTSPTMKSVLMKESECPICLQEMLGRIWQCESGHLVCEDCHSRPEVGCCPTCRASFMGRATAVEQIVKTLRGLAARS